MARTNYEDDYVVIKDGYATIKESAPPIWDVVINSRWPLFKAAKLEDFARLMPGVKKAVEDRKGLYISGGLGAGKTHLLVAIYRHVSESGETPMITSVMEMIDGFKSEIESHESWRLPMFQAAPWLFLDDVGSGLLTRYVADKLLSVLTYRYDHELPTFWTSNFALDQLAEALNKDGNMDGERIASRIQGMCGLLVLAGQDRRLQT